MASYPCTKGPSLTDYMPSYESLQSNTIPSCLSNCEKGPGRTVFGVLVQLDPSFPAVSQHLMLQADLRAAGCRARGTFPKCSYKRDHLKFLPEDRNSN